MGERDKTGAALCPAKFNTDCGYYGIKKGECQGRGCCWAEGSTGNWCFPQDNGIILSPRRGKSNKVCSSMRGNYRDWNKIHNRDQGKLGKCIVKQAKLPASLSNWNRSTLLKELNGILNR